MNVFLVRLVFFSSILSLFGEKGEKVLRNHSVLFLLHELLLAAVLRERESHEHTFLLPFHYSIPLLSPMLFIPYIL